MSVVPLFIRSLIVTSLLSFMLPLAILGAVWTILCLVSSISQWSELGTYGHQLFVAFLTTFGTGDPVAGALTIGLTCSFVGSLFDLFASHRYHCDRWRAD